MEDRPRMRLYQVLAPSLVGRARHFGSAVALKSEWVCVDAPYFDAPAAAEFALSPRDVPPQQVRTRSMPGPRNPVNVVANSVSYI